MKTIIVGGFWGETPKVSSIITKLSKLFAEIDVFNSGTFEELKHVATLVPNYDLVIWMPDISNDNEEIQVFKKIGSVMIVSKVLRENRTRIDAVTRIFKFGANGVIAINKNNSNFNFELIDALDNTWIDSTDLFDLHQGIIELTNWTNSAVREGTLRLKSPIDTLIAINKQVQFESAKQNIRYFGNLSTRCTKMFPSLRTVSNSYYVSGRNSDKTSLSFTDMVEVSRVNNMLRYIGERKPSVDTPVQVKLYEILKNINFFIHGHTFIEDAPITEHYYPCGDLREVPEICALIKDSNYGVINLKNHGFLIYADTLENLQSVVDSLKFKVKSL